MSRLSSHKNPDPDGQLSFERLLYGSLSESGSQDAHGALPAKGEGTDPLARETLPDGTLLPEFLPVFGVRLVRADYITLDERPRIRRPKDAADIAWRYLQHSDREQMLALLVDTRNAVIGLHVVSIGDLSSALVHPREVFKAAILANAASLILAHNHPSGDPTPSPEDAAVSRRIEQAGQILGIELLDHIVVGGANSFVSCKERGLF